MSTPQKSLSDRIKGQAVETQLALIAQGIDNIQGVVDGISDTIKEEYIKKDVFDAYIIATDRRINLLEKIVYGLISLIVIGVFGALIRLVVK